jgi:twinkle protein
MNQTARWRDQSKILSLSNMKDSIMYRFRNVDMLQGTKSQYFEFYNKTLKGLRKGELTILTGASGSGKTTFLSQLSIDFLT